MTRAWLALASLLVAAPAASQNHYALRITSPNTSNQHSTHYNFVATSDMAYTRAVTPHGGCAPFTAELTAAPSGMVIQEHTRRPGEAGLSGPAGIFSGQAFELSWPSPTAVGAPHTVTIRITDCDGSQATSSFSLAVSTTRFKYFNAATGSDAGSCTFAAPCQTISACFNTAKAGASDICVFRNTASGTYTFAGVTISLPGNDETNYDWNSADGRATQFMAYPGEAVTWDFGYAFAGTPAPFVWLQADAPVVDGLILVNAYHQGFRLNRRLSLGATIRNVTYGDIGPAIDGLNSAWFLWARGMSVGDILVGNAPVDTGSLDHGAGNILAKFYDVRYQVSAYNVCHANSSPTGDGCIAPKGGLDEFSHRGNYFTGTQLGWYGNLANDDGMPPIPTSGELAYNLFLMGSTTLCVSVGNRAGGEVVGAIHIYRNTFRCDVYVYDLGSDDAAHTAVQNVLVNNGGTGGACPGRYTCSGIVDTSKFTVANDLDGAVADGIIDANGSLAGAYIAAHGPSSPTPKGHQLSGDAPAPSTGVRRPFRTTGDNE